MAINEKTLTKGQIRKLNALRKSLGDKIADKAFAQWMKEQPAKVVTAKSDPVAEKLVAAMASLSKDKGSTLVVRVMWRSVPRVRVRRDLWRRSWVRRTGLRQQPTDG